MTTEKTISAEERLEEIKRCSLSVQGHPKVQAAILEQIQAAEDAAWNAALDEAGKQIESRKEAFDKKYSTNIIRALKRRSGGGA